MANEYEYQRIVDGLIDINYGGLMKIADDLAGMIKGRVEADEHFKITDPNEMASLLYDWATAEKEALIEREAARKAKAA